MSAAQRVPAAILMSGTGSNARRLLEQPEPSYEVRLLITDNPSSNAPRIAREFGVECAVHDIYRFCGVPCPGSGLDEEGRRRLRDPGLRAAYDLELDSLLARCGARLAALAGYDWVLGPELCRDYLLVNVHPGDLRVKDSSGRRLYVGLGWIPTARAILNGELFARSSTHLVTAQLDGGPIARISPPVPISLPQGVTSRNILPAGVSLGEVIRDIRSGGKLYGDALIFTHSRSVQERLKAEGDWVEFPRTMQRLAELLIEGRLVRDAGGALRLDGQTVGDLFLQGE